MNCEAIDSVLDEHRTALLSPAERQETAQHVGGCARCTDAWLVDDALRAEAIGDPPPELFAALLQRVAAAPAPPRGAWRRRSVALVGAAAAVALVAIVPRLSVVLVSDASSTAEMAADMVWSTLKTTVNTPSLAAATFVAGRDYEVLRAATALPATAEGIPVTEFFMYLCFPCYAFEPELVRWDEETASQVSLTRVPAVFYASADLHARAFYTAEVLGKLDAMHAAFYEEIHTRGNRLESRAALAEFFARFDVDAATFYATFDSSEVDARVERAIALSAEYAIRATPSFVVAGRYSTKSSLAWPNALAVVDYLVAQEVQGAAE